MRIIIGGLVGGIVYFAWGAVSWMVLPWHNATMASFDNEVAVVDVLRQQVPKSGVYIFPGWPKERTEEACKDMEARQRQGPVGLLIYHADGMEIMPPSTFVKSIINDFLAAWLVALMMAKGMAGRGLIGRAACAVIMGLFAGLVGEVSNWIWMNYPANFVFVIVADLAVGWAIAGLAIASIVKPSISPQPTPLSISGIVEPG